MELLLHQRVSSTNIAGRTDKHATYGIRLDYNDR